MTEKIEQIGRMMAVYIDLGCLIFQAEGTNDMNIETIDFWEFEQLGLKPDKTWEGRSCKIVREDGDLTGVMLGW